MLAPIGWLVWMVPVALLTMWPWLRAQREAKARIAAALTTLGAPTAPTEDGALVTLEGRLEVEEEGQSFDGRVAAIARVEGMMSSEHASGEGLALIVGTDRVPLDGAPVLLTGSRESREAVLDLDDRARERFEGEGHVRLLSLAHGDAVRARGRLVRRASTASSSYRERESAWSLAPEDDHDRLELAYAGAPRVPRLSTKRLIVRGVFAAALVLGVVPFALSKTARSVGEHGRARIASCDVEGMGAARTADRVLALVESAPGWGPWTASVRYDAVALLANAAPICAFAGTSLAVDMAVSDYVIERLPAVDAGRSVWGRSRVESFLHSIGRDDAIVALEARLSPSGEGDERARAHLSRGDLDGAARVWRTPGIVSARPYVMTGRANVLCMAGDHADAIAAFEAIPPAWARSATLGRYAECLLRADRARELEAYLARMQTAEHVEAELAYYGAELAARASDPDAVLAHVGRFTSDHAHHHLLLLHALARAGRIEDAVRAFPSGRLGQEAARRGYGLAVYSPIWVPMVDLRRLRATAQALAASSVEGARAVAGELVLALAVRLARRWDPAADDELERAAALLPDPEPAHRARRTMRVHHGHLDDLSALPSDDAEAYRRLRDGEAPRWTLESTPQRQLMYPVLTLHGTVLVDALAVLSTTLSPDALMALLRRQEGASSLPETFLRLTLVIVHGRRLRQDVSVEEARLAGLRRLLDAQRNPRLLEGEL